MTHPNYMLNPGDMFSVDQRKVLWATGAPKLGRIKVVREDESEGDEAASEEAPDPVTPDEVAAEAVAGARKAAGVPAEREGTGGEFAGKRGPEKKPWTKHDDPNNPIDVTKPYATPWRPRDYLPPFAFIPRYLEVHITPLYFCARGYVLTWVIGQPQHMPRSIPSPSRCPTWID